ncbi:hypothetical protein FBQ99_14720 [Chloroflexi bacterium CFX2]|nr:hypothetical protein [Chloroflexi bacterium CFX2]
MKIKTIVTALVVAFILSSCSPPLIVPLDNLGYAQSGGESLTTFRAYKRDFPNNEFPNDFECYSGSDCLRVEYYIQNHRRFDWSLIAWYPYNCDRRWVDIDKVKCITDLLKSGNFKEIQHLTLWARGRVGNEIVEFGVGDKNELVVGSFGFNYYLKPQRQPAGRVILTSHWKKYEIDLADRDLTHVVPLFYVYYTVDDNPQGAIFYVDDIQFEGY